MTGIVGELSVADYYLMEVTIRGIEDSDTRRALHLHEQGLI